MSPRYISLGAAVAILCCGCEHAGAPSERPAAARPPRPAGAVAVPAGGALQASVDAAPAGAVLALEPGEHRGPVRIDKAVVIWGDAGAVVRSAGVGSTIDVVSPDVQLLGFTVDGSGSRFDLTDAAVRVRADDVRIEGLTVRRALFGVLVEKCDRALVRGNVVRGNGEPSLGLRGDAIRLWEVRDAEVADNVISDSRDVVIWYSSDNRLVGNTVERSRYGTHLMYSHDNLIADNRYLHNVVSVFLMYSDGVTLQGNTLAFSSGAAGLGLGLKESGNITVSGNVFARDNVAVHSDNSPLNSADRNSFEGNLFQSCDTAVVFNGIAERCSFTGNTFRGNLEPVRVDGGDDAMSVLWDGNDFDDYRGYDFDGDGVGDVPYEHRSLATQLTARFPDLAFFRGAPALGAIDVSSHVMPMFRPKTILVDRHPALRGTFEGLGRAR